MAKSCNGLAKLTALATLFRHTRSRFFAVIPNRPIAHHNLVLFRLARGKPSTLM